jgi:hypothetical protein
MTPEQKPGKDAYPAAHPGAESDPVLVGEIAAELYGDKLAAGLSTQDYLLELIRRRNAGEPIDDAAMMAAIQAADDELFRHRKR